MTGRDGLPRRVYIKHGRYYYVTPDSKWVGLTRVRMGLPAMHRALADLLETEVTGALMPAVIARWLESKRSVWSPAVASAQSVYAARMAEAFAEFSPAQVTTPVCAQYLANYRHQPRTHNFHRTMLRQVLAAAAVEGLREGHNPVDNIKPMTMAPRRRIVTDAELAVLRAADTAGTVTRMLDLALITGQRIGDLIALRWQDVAAEGLVVVQQKTKERLLIEWSDALRAAVDACAVGRARLGHLLVNEAGKPWSYSGIKQAWARACARAGIADLHIHDLRGRAGVDALLAAGEDLRAAQRLLGHSGEAMTRRYVDGKYHKRAKPSR